MRIRLMTYNLGGARTDSGSRLADAARVVKEIQPDILALQEVAEVVEADGTVRNSAALIARELGYFRGHAYGPTISMQTDMYAGKPIFNDALFSDWQDWRQGNAILSRWEFVRLGDTERRGDPRNIPLFRPIRYEGSRDTDPRYALLGRVNAGAVCPYVMCTHLSTLVGERGNPERVIQGKVEEAQAMRADQVRHLLSTIGEHILRKGKPAFLMGDLNAPARESCVAGLLVHEAGFVRLVPENAGTPTHLYKATEPIDHILVSPPNLVTQYRCTTVDSPLARQASDHLPVVAEVTLR